MRHIFLIFCTTLVLSACSDKKVSYDDNQCSELSMAAFRGSPKAAHEFKENCQQIKVTYTKEICQKALGELILGKPLSILEETYGVKVGLCFSKNDIEKFAQEQDKAKLMNMSK